MLEQLRQRISVNYHLTPLDAADTEAYVNYRLEHAALGEPPRFTTDAAALIHDRSGGVPRIINVICDAALIFGYAEEQRSLDRPLLMVVVEELESTGILLPQGGSVRGRVPAAADAQAAPAAPQSAAHPAPASSDAELRRLERWVAVQEAELLRQREAVERRNSDLVSREQALAARERRVVEQQRILSEEYRLMRQRHRSTAAAVKPPTAAPEVPAAVRTHPSPSAPPSVLQRLFQALRLDTGWVDPAARRR